MNKMVDMQKAFDAVCKYFHLGNAVECNRLYTALEEAYELTAQPDKQKDKDRQFMELTVRNSNGKPYYSIVYLVFDDDGIGHDIEGYSSYSLDVISVYLKQYFGFAPSVQPDQKSGRWVRESLVTNYPYKCSACKKYSRARYDFCPNCGSDNREESDNGRFD